MALARRATNRMSGAIWPGFVDALTALLLILMFVLSIFMIVQFSLRERITGQDKKLEALTEEVTAQDSQIDNLTGQLAALSNALGLEQDRADIAETEANNLRATLVDERAEIARLGAALEVMTAERDRAAGDVTRLTGALETATVERDAAGAEVTRLTGALDVSAAEARALAARLAEAEASITEQEAAAREAAARRQALEAMIADLEATRDTRDAEIATLNAEQARAQALLAALQSQTDNQQARIERLAGLLDARGAESSTTARERDAALTAKDEALALAARLRDENADILGRVEQLTADQTATLALVAQLREEGADLLRRVEELDAEKAATLALLAQLEDGKSRTDTELATLRQERADRLAEIEALGTDKAAALALVEQLRTDLSAAEARQEGDRTALAEFEKLSAAQALALATIARLEDAQASLSTARDQAETRAATIEVNLQAALTRAAELSASLTEAEEARLAEVAAATALREKLAQSDAELDAATLALNEAREEAARTLELLAAAEASRKELEEAALAGTDGVDRERALRLAAQTKLSEAEALTVAEQRKVAALNLQVRELNDQLGALRALLDEAGEKDRQSQVQIAALGAQLNQALARKVSELSRFQSEFFGKMTEVLGGKDGVRVVGDRFVFQSEILFSSASATLGAEGQGELSKLATVVRELSESAPADLNWVLRIDGHTDPVPLSGSGRFRDNWELSQARALSVVRYLIDVEGIPPNRLAATGFGEFQPIDTGSGPAANARNRRIEFKFTER